MCAYLSYALCAYLSYARFNLELGDGELQICAYLSYARGFLCWQAGFNLELGDGELQICAYLSYAPAMRQRLSPAGSEIRRVNLSKGGSRGKQRQQTRRRDHH